jgi:hypothetical protein
VPAGVVVLIRLAVLTALRLRRRLCRHFGELAHYPLSLLAHAGPMGVSLGFLTPPAVWLVSLSQLGGEIRLHSCRAIIAFLACSCAGDSLLLLAGGAVFAHTFIAAFFVAARHTFTAMHQVRFSVVQLYHASA